MSQLKILLSSEYDTKLGTFQYPERIDSLIGYGSNYWCKSKVLEASGRLPGIILTQNLKAKIYGKYTVLYRHSLLSVGKILEFITIPMF